MLKQTAGASIYGHDDFRSYLKHVLEQEKATSSGGSLNGFAKRLKLSPSLLKMILAGQRDLSPQAMHKIAFALRLNDRERQKL